jgi:hypothetical protein
MRTHVPGAELTHEAIKVWMAFHLIKTSLAATHWTWMPLCSAVNMGMILAEREIGAEYMNVFIDAQDAIARAWLRAGQKGIARLDGPGIRAIALALEVHDEQCKVAYRYELVNAQHEMIRRHHKGNTVVAEKTRKAA